MAVMEIPAEPCAVDALIAELALEEQAWPELLECLRAIGEWHTNKPVQVEFGVLLNLSFPGVNGRWSAIAFELSTKSAQMQFGVNQNYLATSVAPSANFIRRHLCWLDGNGADDAGIFD